MFARPCIVALGGHSALVSPRRQESISDAFMLMADAMAKNERMNGREMKGICMCK